MKVGISIGLPGTFYTLDYKGITSIYSDYKNTILTKNVNNANNIMVEVSGSFNADEISRIIVTDSYGKSLSDVIISYDNNIKKIEGRAEVYVDNDEFYACDKLVVSKEGYCTSSIDISQYIWSNG